MLLLKISLLLPQWSLTNLELTTEQAWQTSRSDWLLCLPCIGITAGYIFVCGVRVLNWGHHTDMPSTYSLSHLPNQYLLNIETCFVPSSYSESGQAVSPTLEGYRVLVNCLVGKGPLSQELGGGKGYPHTYTLAASNTA